MLLLKWFKQLFCFGLHTMAPMMGPIWVCSGNKNQCAVIRPGMDHRDTAAMVENTAALWIGGVVTVSYQRQCTSWCCNANCCKHSSSQQGSTTIPHEASPSVVAKQGIRNCLECNGEGTSPHGRASFLELEDRKAPPLSELAPATVQCVHLVGYVLLCSRAR